MKLAYIFKHLNLILEDEKTVYKREIINKHKVKIIKKSKDQNFNL